VEGVTSGGIQRLPATGQGQLTYTFRTPSICHKDSAISVRKSQDCGNMQKPAYTKVIDNDHLTTDEVPIIKVSPAKLIHTQNPVIFVHKSQNCGNIQKPAYTKVIDNDHLTINEVLIIKVS
jgi:hypothetical protein